MNRRPSLKEEEKKRRLLDLLQKTKHAMTMQEIEKRGDKEYQIVPSAIKPLVEQMIALGDIDMDRLGSGNFFWSLASKAARAKQREIAKIKQELQALKAPRELQQEVTRLTSERQTSAERTEKLRQLNSLRSRKRKLDQSSSQITQSDLEHAAKKLKSGISVAKTAANRWTENVEILIQYFKKDRGEFGENERKELLDEFELPNPLLEID